MTMKTEMVKVTEERAQEFCIRHGLSDITRLELTEALRNAFNAGFAEAIAREFPEFKFDEQAG